MQGHSQSQQQQYQHALVNQASQLQSQAMLTSFPLAHDDYVHDIAFDFYGKRIATASSDQKIKIWEKKQGNEGQLEWQLVEELTGNLGHPAAVLRVKWADPEFGNILASCSYDRQVFIWEEVESKDFSKKSWTRRYNQIEKETIQDIKFAPRHWGLMLAVAVADGSVKIYAAKDLNNMA